MITRVGRNFAAQALQFGLSFLDRFLVVGILVHAWGPGGFADWTVLFSAAGLVTLGELGLNVFYGNALQRARANSDTATFDRMVSVALGCSLLLGLALAAAVVAVSLLIGSPPSVTSAAFDSDTGSVVFLLLAAANISRAMRGGISQIYRGNGVFARGLFIDSCQPAAAIGGIAVAVLMGAGPMTVAAIYLASDLVAGWALMLRDIMGRFPTLRLTPSLPTAIERREILWHVRWFGIQWCGPIVWTQVPVLLLSHLGTGSAAIVSFVLLRTLVNTGRQVGVALANSAGVEIAAEFHRGQRESVGRHVEAFGVILSAVSGATAVGIMAFGEPLVELWTGHASLFDYSVVGWLIACGLMTAPSAPLVAVLMFTGLLKTSAFAHFTMVAVGIPACALLAANYGAAGAAAGLAAGEILAFSVMMPLTSAHLLAVSYTGYILRCLSAMVLAALYCGAIAAVVVRGIPLDSGQKFVWAGLLWGILGVLPALAAAMPQHQRAALLGVLRASANRAGRRLSLR